jgi:ectoine hydroxylase-related dioxygenase (phytanoyl-CoA dioxygenase family)
MSAGSVLLFGPYSVHGSQPNTSARPRRTFINGYAYPGANARIYPGEGAGRLLSCETGRADERESRIA